MTPGERHHLSWGWFELSLEGFIEWGNRVPLHSLREDYQAPIRMGPVESSGSNRSFTSGLSRDLPQQRTEHTSTAASPPAAIPVTYAEDSQAKPAIGNYNAL